MIRLAKVGGYVIQICMFALASFWMRIFDVPVPDRIGIGLLIIIGAIIGSMFGAQRDTTHVRAMVSHLRTRNELPIGSNGKGYFWALKPDQLESTIDHLEARIQKERAVIRGLKRAQKDLEMAPLRNRLI